MKLIFDYVVVQVKNTKGKRYFACAYFKGHNGTAFDIDFYVDDENGS